MYYCSDFLYVSVEKLLYIPMAYGMEVQFDELTFKMHFRMHHFINKFPDNFHWESEFSDTKEYPCCVPGIL